MTTPILKLRGASTLQCLLLGAALCSIAAPTAAQTASDAPLLAVLELNNKLPAADQAGIDAAYLANVIRGAALKAVPNGRVMTKENVIALIGTAGKALADCEGECEVDTGRRLGADLLVTGDLLRFGSKIKLDLRLYSTFEARLIAVAQASGGTPDELEGAAQRAAQELFTHNSPDVVAPRVPIAQGVPPSSSPADIPPLRDDLLSPSTDSSPEALVALQLATPADHAGWQSPDEAAAAWGKVAAAPAPNPYVQAAQERQRLWTHVSDAKRARAQQATAAFARMVKLFALRDLSPETKRKIGTGFQKQYGEDAFSQETAKLDPAAQLEVLAALGRILVDVPDGWRDSKTNLVWKKEVSTQPMAEDAAVRLCASLMRGQWRLPTASELADTLAFQRAQGLPMPMTEATAQVWAGPADMATHGWTIVPATGKRELVDKESQHRVLCVGEPSGH